MSPKPLTILHCSDWHLGRGLYDHSRHDEYRQFLNWLAETLTRQAVDVLLVSGDIFDNTTPSSQTQEMYFNFLSRIIRDRCCRHVVIIAGNHDSPSLLAAPRNLLRSFNIHVVGSISENIPDEVIVLRDSDGVAELIVCAVPYLRDRDIRLAEAGEDLPDKERQYVNGTREHIRAVCDEAIAVRKTLDPAPPIVAMGHLYSDGSVIAEGDGVRNRYVGTIPGVSADIFPSACDYVALGHIHIPQAVCNNALVRYSGSPIPIGFNEGEQQKSVCLVRFTPTAVHECLPIPLFQRLEHIKGDMPAIKLRLEELARLDESVWLEVTYNGEASVFNFREQLEQAIAGTKLELFRFNDSQRVNRTIAPANPDEDLEDLDENEVFRRCLDSHNVSDDDRPALLQTFAEILRDLHEEDQLAGEGDVK